MKVVKKKKSKRKRKQIQAKKTSKQHTHTNIVAISTSEPRAHYWRPWRPYSKRQNWVLIAAVHTSAAPTERS